MKKLLFTLVFTAILLCACTPVDIDDSVSNGQEKQPSVADALSSGDSSAASNAESSALVEESSATVTESSVEESSEDTTVDVPNYTYKISLTDEELACINAGTNGEYLILVNKTHVLPDDFSPAEKLVDIRDTRKDRAAEKMVYTAEVALHAMLKEAAANGYGDVTITSGYRSIAKQQSLFNMYVNQEMAKGKDRESAIAAASVYSAYPGTSEHHTGLCADMHNLPAASQTFGSTGAAKWLAANAHKFGFILRFPQDKVDITGYMWEPWHFRFVGVYHATQIYNGGMCLEEYLSDAEVG